MSMLNVKKFFDRYLNDPFTGSIFQRLREGLEELMNAEESMIETRLKLFAFGEAIDGPKFYINTTSTNGSGIAIAYLTEDATAGGAAIFSSSSFTKKNVFCDADNGTDQYVVDKVLSGDKKMITLTVKKVITVLGVLSLQTPSAGTEVSVRAVGA